MTTISSKALQELGAAQMNCADVSSELVRGLVAIVRLVIGR